MRYEEITDRILATAFDVCNELGSGFLESVYEKSLLIALRQNGLSAESQVSIDVNFRDQNVGHFAADIIVEKKVLIELKTVDQLVSKHISQVLNYLKATGIEVGLLINFGNSKLEYRRFNNRFG